MVGSKKRGIKRSMRRKNMGKAYSSPDRGKEKVYSTTY